MGFWVSDLVFTVWSSRCRIHTVYLPLCDSRVLSLGFRVCGLGWSICGVQVPHNYYSVEDLRSWIWGLRFRVVGV